MDLSLLTSNKDTQVTKMMWFPVYTILIDSFPLWEFLVNTSRNFTGIAPLIWPSRWLCLHCGVGPISALQSQL